MKLVILIGIHLTELIQDEILEKYRTGVDPDLYPNVNWMDLLSDQTHNMRYTLNFRGGTEKTKFFVS